MTEHERTPPEPGPDETEDVGTGIDFADPIKRDADQETMPGLDPVITLPPE